MIFTFLGRMAPPHHARWPGPYTAWMTICILDRSRISRQGDTWGIWGVAGSLSHGRRGGCGRAGPGG